MVWGFGVLGTQNPKTQNPGEIKIIEWLIKLIIKVNRFINGDKFEFYFLKCL